MIVHLLRDRGQVMFDQLLKEFGKVATSDEVRVAGTKKAFQKILMDTEFVELCQGNVSLRAGMERDIKDILAHGVSTSGQVNVDQEPQFDLKLQEVGHSAVVTDADVVNSEQMVATSLITGNKEDDRLVQTTAGGQIDVESWNGVKSYENVSEDSQCISVSTEISDTDQEAVQATTTGKEDNHSPDNNGCKARKKVARKKSLSKKYALKLQQYVHTNGPSTLQQLLSVLYKDDEDPEKALDSTEKLTKLLKSHVHKFTFLPSGLVGPNEVKLKAANKIVNFLQEKGGACSSAEVDDWFCQHANRKEIRALWEGSRLKRQKTFKELLMTLPHLFVVEGDSVSPHPSVSNILKRWVSTPDQEAGASQSYNMPGEALAAHSYSTHPGEAGTAQSYGLEASIMGYLKLPFFIIATIYIKEASSDF